MHDVPLPASKKGVVCINQGEVPMSLIRQGIGQQRRVDCAKSVASAGRVVCRTWQWLVWQRQANAPVFGLTWTCRRFRHSPATYRRLGVDTVQAFVGAGGSGCDARYVSLFSNVGQVNVAHHSGVPTRHDGR